MPLFGNVVASCSWELPAFKGIGVLEPADSATLPDVVGRAVPLSLETLATLFPAETVLGPASEAMMGPPSFGPAGLMP